MFTGHAKRRLAERGIREDDVRAALQLGVRFRRQGVVFYHVRKKDLPEKMPERARRRLEGLTVVMSPAGGAVISAYKNHNDLKRIKRPPKRRQG